MFRNAVDKYDGFFQRLFEIVPGFLIWVLLTSPLWASLNFPILIGNFIIIFAVYWLYKSIAFFIGIVVGYNRYKEALKINWLEECNKLDFSTLPNTNLLPIKSKLPKHLIVIPIGGAKYETLKPTLEAIRDQNYPQDLIYVSLSFEERLVEKDVEYFENMKQRLKEEFSVFGERLMIFTHPKDIVGEAIGASANRTWGNKKAVEVLENAGENLNDFLTTSPDEDLRFHQEYLAAVSYKFLTAEKRNQKFYQTAAYLFSNNYWEVPMMIRVWSMSLTLPVLSSSITNKHDRETWSCYSVSLQVMKDVNYWDTSIGIDDTLFFWRPYDLFDGDFKCEVFFIPLYADAVYHPSKVKNYVNQYKQLVRWGWGVVVFPIALKVLTRNKNIPLKSKIRKIYIMLQIFVVFKVTAILFTIGIPIVGIINESFNYSVLAYSLPLTLSTIMKVLTLMLIPTIYYKSKLIPPYPKSWSKLRFILSFLLEIPFHILILFTYAFFPFIVGPTKMMLGMKYEFLVTEKKVGNL